VSLADIDIFWTRLDFMPEVAENPEFDFQHEMNAFAEQLRSQPVQVKKSMLQKMKEVLNPIMTKHKPPEVQTDTRGRPTTSEKEKKEDKAAVSIIIIINIIIVVVVVVVI
jgi:hypothetical protein